MQDLQQVYILDFFCHTLEEFINSSTIKYYVI
jgi:hypothetical protein